MDMEKIGTVKLKRKNKKIMNHMPITGGVVLHGVLCSVRKPNVLIG